MSERSNPRNLLFSGAAEWMGKGIQEYNLSARPTRSLGAVKRVCTKTRNSPKSTSIWGIIGPRQPKGLMPDSL